MDANTIFKCKKVWRCDVPTKVAVLAWRLLIYKLPTRDLLLLRGVVSPENKGCCVLCFREEQSANHMFSLCTVMQGVSEEIFG